MASHLAATGLFWLLFSCLSATLYGFFRRLHWALLPGALFCCLFSWASRCKMDINGAPIQLSDFSFLGTAGEIAGFASTQLLPSLPALAAFLVLLLLLAWISWRETWRLPTIPGFILGSLSMVLLISAFFPGPLQAAALALDQDCRDPLERTEEQGVVLGLYTAWAQRQFTGQVTASGDVALMTETFLEDATADRAPLPLSQAPDIIFITSESFFDVTRLPGLTFREDPLPVFHALSETCTNGAFLSNTYGGGTGYVEMELFTGLTSSFLREGDTLSTLDQKTYRTLPTTVRLLNQLGYTTLSLHAHSDALYNRSRIYPAIGFQEVLFLEDFMTEPENKGTYTSDESFAREIIAQYEARDKASPCFIYGLSMENHQAYFPGKFSEPSGCFPESSELSAWDLAALDALIMGLRDADASLGLLTDYFSQADRPVMLIFVGDHLPSMNLSDGTSIYTRLGYSPSEESSLWDPQTMKNMLSTDYLIWTNYEKQPQPDRVESCTFFGLRMLQRAGLPLNAYFSWLKEDVASRMLLSRNRFFADAEGTPFHEIPSSLQDTADLYADLERTLIYGQ